MPILVKRGEWNDGVGFSGPRVGVIENATDRDCLAAGAVDGQAGGVSFTPRFPGASTGRCILHNGRHTEESSTKWKNGTKSWMF